MSLNVLVLRTSQQGGGAFIYRLKLHVRLSQEILRDLETKESHDNVTVRRYRIFQIQIYCYYYCGYIPGGKGGRYVRLTTSPPSCAECHENLRA